MITVITLLRVIPYVLAGLLAWQKGYKRLSIAMAYVICIALVNLLFHISPEGRGLMASVFALLIGWHAADLQPKQRR